MSAKVIASQSAPAAMGPYSQALDLGSLVFCSGQLGLVPATGKLPEGLEAQAEQMFANIKAVLAEAGLTTANVVKTTVFLADMNDFKAFNAIYANPFTEPFPARSCVQVAKLPAGALVECEVIAAR